MSSINTPTQPNPSHPPHPHITSPSHPPLPLSVAICQRPSRLSGYRQPRKTSLSSLLCRGTERRRRHRRQGRRPFTYRAYICRGARSVAVADSVPGVGRRVRSGPLSVRRAPRRSAAWRLLIDPHFRFRARNCATYTALRMRLAMLLSMPTLLLQAWSC